MSKTDKTAPYYVKWFYDPNYLEAVHRHGFHDCNLPPKPKPTDHFREVHFEQLDGPCFWWPSFHYYRSRWAKCGCYMCGYDAFQLPRYKRERIEGKRYCQDGWRNEY